MVETDEEIQRIIQEIENRYSISGRPTSPRKKSPVGAQSWRGVRNTGLESRNYNSEEATSLYGMG
tara:strand:+ start:492 stop:686 length:195 start_codon:yes stop_codon:yes gene_type:complete